MGSDVLIRIMKCVVIWIRVCYRSVCHHPFLVGFLCWLYIFHRLFPALFSLVVSASPVLITTALLLGTLLSYGESNLPELQKEVSERSAGPDGGLGAGDAGFDVGKLTKARDLEDEDSDDEKESEKGEVKEEDSDDGFEDDDDNKPLIKGKSRKGKFEKWAGEEAVRGSVRSLEVDDEKRVSRTLGEESGREDEGAASHNGEAVGGLYAPVPNLKYERLESEDKHLFKEAVDDPFSFNAVYTSFSLSPKHEEADDNQGSNSQNENDHISESESDEDEYENSSDSESDADESSSPDDSLADIMPLLDELHPLLDVDAPQPAHDSFKSTAHRSADASSLESADDSENQEDEDGEEGGVDDGNVEDAQSNKGEGDKPEITWTEDDQKNLMDLGTSELERNQRLENLIARRRAWKNKRLADEKNLIDLESTDLPFNVPHIITQKRNPFDAPSDSYDMMGLPPIPGSAPSILQLRRNPFDLPYDQNEEKPILTGDNFAQEYITPQRDPFFRRYESFSVGPLTVGNSSQEMRWRPYFVPERTAAEEAYASIQRQMSEVTESKSSSVSETESVSSATDNEDRKFSEPVIIQETNMISKDEHESDHAKYESRSSEDEKSADVEHTNRDVNQNEFDIQLRDQGSLQETETNVAVIEESSYHVEFGQSGHSEINMRVHAVDEDSEGSRHSSPTVGMPVKHDEISMEMGYVPDSFRAGTSFSGSVETTISEMHLPTEQVVDGSDSSSVTSLSETNEEVSDTIGRSESIGETGDIIEDSHSVIHSPVGESSVNFRVELPDDHHVKEPVYDSSPPSMKNHLLFSSASIDCQPESSEASSPAVVDESETQYLIKDFEVHSELEVIAGSSSEGTHIDSSILSTDNENQETHSASQTVGQEDKEPSYKDENTGCEHVQQCNMEVLTDVDQTSISEATSTSYHHSILADITLFAAGQDQPHLKAEQVSEIDGGSSSSDTDSLEENHVSKKDMLQVELDEVQPSIQDDNESLVVQDSNVGPNASSDSDSLEGHMGTRTLQVDRDELPTPSVDNDAPNQEQVSAESSNQQKESEGKSSLGVNQKQKVYETPTTVSSSNNNQETTEPSTVEAELVKEASSDDTAPRIVPEVSVAIPLKNRLIESIKEISLGGVPSENLDEFQTPVSARYFDFTSEDFQPNARCIEEVEGETEEFKDLDEGFLAELDRVGDFSVPNSEQVLTVNHIGETNTEISIFEASSVNSTGMAFHHIDDGVPVEEVILPSLLFGARAVVDSKDVPASEPDSPFSNTKEVSQENEEMVSPNTDAREKTEVELTSSGSSANSELQKEGMHPQEHDAIESPKHTPEETPAKSPKRKEKSHDSSSDSSSSDSDSD